MKFRRATEQAVPPTSPFVLAEAALELILRAGPLPVSLYLIGALPFVAGLLAYWAAMSSSAFAHHYASAGALGLALLFLWMKAMHARFAMHLAARLHHTAAEPWRPRELLFALCRQGALHATAVIVYPVAFLTVIPMGIAATFYQNASALEHGHPSGFREIVLSAGAEAARWPRQAHLLLWACSPLLVCTGALIYLVSFPLLDALAPSGSDDPLVLLIGYAYGGAILLAVLPLSPFPCIVFLNVFTGLAFAVEFFHILTGAQTVYALNPGAVMGNPALAALAACLTYICLDPILKAACVLRCHQGASMRTGADLRVRLETLRRQANWAAAAGVTAALVLLALGSSPAHAQTTSARVDQAALDQAIERELAEIKYTWRMPREASPNVDTPWLIRALADLGETIRDGVKRAIDFVSDLWDRFMTWLRGGRNAAGSGWRDGAFNPSIRLLIALLVAVLIAATLFLLWRTWRTRQPAAEPALATPTERPDIEKEETSAAALPEDEWLQLARELAARGEYRLAARAAFFAILATLAGREIIRIARHKSNYDYDREIARRAAILGDAPAAFSRGALIYECVWYGEHPAGPETLDELHTCRERLRDAVQ